MHLVDDLLGRLAADRAPAVGAVRVADPGVQHPQVVVDLGDRADGGARVPRRGLLVDGDGRREPFDEVDVGLLHLAQELPGVGRQRLHVPSLALGVDRVEGERGLPGAGQAREHDQLVARKVERDVLEVVLTGTVDDEAVGAHTAGQCRGERRHDRSAPILRRMDRDLRETPAVPRTSRRSSSELLEPGFGDGQRPERTRASPDGTLVAFRGSAPGRLEGPDHGRPGSAWRRPTAPDCARSPTARTTTPARSGRRTADADLPSATARRRDGSSSTRWRPTCSARPASSPPWPGVVEHHAWSPDGSAHPDGGGRDERRTGRRAGLGHPGRAGPGGIRPALAPRGGVLR